MNEQIKSVNITEVAEPFLLKLDLQQFADGEPTDEPIDNEPIDNEPVVEPTDEPIDNEPGEKVEEPANPQDTPIQDDKANAAFAQIRREKEAYEQQVRQMDQMVTQMYGDQGIFTFDQYQQAVQAQQQEAERQQYREAGLPDDLADKLSKVDEVLQRVEKENSDRQLVDNYSSLQKEYPDLVKNPEDIPEAAWQKWNDGKTGLTLTEAYELVNKQAIREHLQASTKQSTLNKINSKEHIRGNGGEGSDDIDITSVPADVLTSYRQMFAKELRTGKMTDKDFVNDYKKHAKG